MALTYTCVIQGQWFEVPRTLDGLAEISDELDSLVDGEAARATLQAAAEALVADVGSTDDDPDRHTWGGVGEREVGAIVAVMTIQGIKQRGLDLDAILADWSTTESDGGVDVWLRDYQKKELSGRPAVSGHDITQLPAGESGERYLRETYRAAIAAPGLSTFIFMVITTDDLTVFDDITSYGDTLADTFEFGSARGAA
ncbi:hypothetical protein GCM10027568_21020 [Humibacter soli]